MGKSYVMCCCCCIWAECRCGCCSLWCFFFLNTTNTHTKMPRKNQLCSSLYTSDQFVKIWASQKASHHKKKERKKTVTQKSTSVFRITVKGILCKVSLHTYKFSQCVVLITRKRKSFQTFSCCCSNNSSCFLIKSNQFPDKNQTNVPTMSNVSHILVSVGTFGSSSQGHGVLY